MIQQIGQPIYKWFLFIFHKYCIDLAIYLTLDAETVTYEVYPDKQCRKGETI